MKKIAVLVVVVAVFFASSGPISGCELCEGLRGLGYTDTQISGIIRSGANRADAEAKMRQKIAEGRPVEARPPVVVAVNRPVEVKPQQLVKSIEAPIVKTEAPRLQQPRQQTAESVTPHIVAAGNQGFLFSNEVIEVPPDIERR